MDRKVPIKRSIHPKDKANFLSHFLFCWQLPIFVRAYKNPFTEDDLYAPLKEHDSKRLADQLEQLWKEEEYFQDSPSLWRAIFRMFGFKFILLGFLGLLSELVVFTLHPFYLKKLLDYHVPNQSEITKQEAYLFALYIALLCIFLMFTFHWHRVLTCGIGMKLRMACCSLIYRRALRMNQTSFQKLSIGHIVNLMTNDLSRFDTGLMYLHYLWVGVIEIMILGSYLYFSLGPTAATGLGVLILCLLIQIYVFKLTSSYKKAASLKTDYRIRLMNDIICGIKIIKMYTWEKPFGKVVESFRRLELDQLFQTNGLKTIISTSRLYTARLSLLLCIFALVKTDLPLTPQYVFIALNVYENLKISIGVGLIKGTVYLSEIKVAVKRIQEFLVTERTMYNKLQSCKVVPTSLTTFQKKVLGIKAKNASIKWNESDGDILSALTFDFHLGELIGVVGRAGVGKSSLLQAILKENIVKGMLEVEGVVSYASQEPWIFPASIRQNILFGEEMDEVKYSKVIRICALEHDLTVLPYGDQTLVGERGVMLSGGQKARINLARAVYRDADIYLLDDPLSAVDAHVARHIFFECILGYLKHKCVVLVTHQVHYLINAKKVYTIELGKMALVEKQSKLEEFKENGKEALIQHKNNMPRKVSEDITNTPNIKVYKEYCSTSGGRFMMVTSLIIFIFAQTTGIVSDYFLSFWINLESSDLEENTFWTTTHCLYLYAGLVLVWVLTLTAGGWIFSMSCKNASRSIHQKMMTSLFHAPITFFNKNTSGRILNRFSKDLGCVDEMIPLLLLDTTLVYLLLFGTCAIISIVNYWLIIPTTIIFIILYCYGILYYPAIRNIKRLEGATRSPIYTHLIVSLQGLTTIRSSKAQAILEQEFDNHQNFHSVPFYLSITFYAALCFWVDVTSTIYISVVIFSFFYESSENYIGDVGLAITQSLTLVGFMQYGMKMWSELDSQMTSAERAIEYGNLPNEPDNGSNNPPKAWPNEGRISFQSVSISYSHDSWLALDQVSFDIEAGAKIGIVGRTGAGKSSLVSALLRLFDYEGKITIDDVDITSVPLESLRSNIAVIPQEPFLLLGTLRKNLDPFDEYSDSQLWNALEEVELKPFVASLPSGLDSDVFEGGSNFSVGQRQLLCLVRAMLKSAKIIVLDEATASVDFKTDELIQTTIRRKFQKCTVLTIAHRLNTIMDSDRILVLDKGRVVEFDRPSMLLTNSNGLFHSYVHENEMQK